MTYNFGTQNPCGILMRGGITVEQFRIEGSAESYCRFGYYQPLTGTRVLDGGLDHGECDVHLPFFFAAASLLGSVLTAPRCHKEGGPISDAVSSRPNYLSSA
jgi:hypothetical protein